MLGLNEQGSSPPLFCVFNASHEFGNLAEALGSEQPVYAFVALLSATTGGSDPGAGAALASEFNGGARAVRCFSLGNVKGAQSPLQWRSISCGGAVICLCLSWSTGQRSLHSIPVTFCFCTAATVSSIQNSHRSIPNPLGGGCSVDLCAEVEGAHAELYLEQNIASLAGELAHRLGQALSRSRKPSPLEDCAVEFAVDKWAARVLPGARLPLEISVKNSGKTAIGGELSSLRLGGWWIRDGAAVGARFVEAAPLPSTAPGDVSTVKTTLSAPENQGNFELALELFEERGHSLTVLSAAPACARVKVTRRATPIRESLRSLFSARKGDCRPSA